MRLGWQTPELLAQSLFRDIWTRVPNDFAPERREPRPPDLGRAVRLLAVTGGYLKYGRKQYAVPRVEIPWKGFVQLAITAQVVERALLLNRSSDVGKMVR